MKYLKVYISFVFVATCFLGQAQENNFEKKTINIKENLAGASYSLLYGTSNEGYDFYGHGFEISYAHLLWEDKLYAVGTGGVTYARFGDNYPSINSGKIRMTIFSVGLGYNFLKLGKSTFSGELGYRSLNHDGYEFYPSLVERVEYTYHTIFAQLKMQYDLSEKFVVMPAMKYGFEDFYETISFKLGLGYRF